jgi:hypothetical protein
MDKEVAYLREHGCKKCGNKEVVMGMVRYSQPLSYEYSCRCGHQGDVQQSNYQIPRINLDAEKYLEAKKIADGMHRDIFEVVEEMGGTVDLGPEPEYAQT